MLVFIIFLITRVISTFSAEVWTSQKKGVSLIDLWHKIVAGYTFHE